MKSTINNTNTQKIDFTESQLVHLKDSDGCIILVMPSMVYTLEQVNGKMFTGTVVSTGKSNNQIGEQDDFYKSLFEPFNGSVNLSN